ncbi:MAG: SPOR domain-containing protein [Bacteroidales bacterium]|nr:SPOR domain-containing protein [Bacteroidales bacterium]
MRKSIILLALLATVLQGCDFLRTVAGRPTTAKLEEIRLEQMRQEEARHQARLDSMRRVQEALADSLAALEAHLIDSLSQARGSIVNPSKLGGLFSTKLDAKYSIIVGAFRNRAYAERKLAACNEAGYKSSIISFRNGLQAVSVCPSNSLDETVKTLKQLRGKGICPEDGWILVNE